MNSTMHDKKNLWLKHMPSAHDWTRALRGNMRLFCPRTGMIRELRLIGAACAFISLAAFFLALPPAARAQKAEQPFGVSVAVLPFEVFSIEKEPALGSEVAAMVSKQLALNPSIVCVESRSITAVLKPDDYLSLNEPRLRQLAKLLNANCIVMGTITKIRSEHSIDVEMFNTAADGPNFKTFSEGLEIKGLVETIVTALDQAIMGKAELIPAAERPRVRGARQTASRTPSGGFDVERELTAAFGPMKEESVKPASGGPETAGDTARAAQALAEEPISDETQTAALPEKAPAAEQSGASEEGKHPKKSKAAEPAAGSAFFSLSKAISINSDSMEYDNRANMATFKGNVVARQDDIVMFANSMHVYYSSGGGLSRVEALGNVRVVQGDRIATGGSIIFNNADQTIVATGDPRVWQGDNVVHGKKITVYLKEERTVVEGEPDSRANATIYPDREKKRP